MSEIIKNTFEKLIIKDNMSENILQVNATDTIENICQIFNKSKKTILIVNKTKNQESGEIIQGIITISDLFNFFKWNDKSCYQKEINGISRFKIISLTLEDTIYDAIKTICKKNIGHLAIIDQHKIIGVLDLFSVLDVIIKINTQYFDKILPIKDCFADFLQHSESEFDELEKKSFKNIFSKNLKSVTSLIREILVVDINLKPLEIFVKMKEAKSKNVIVVEFGFRILGIISEKDFLYKIFFTKNFNISTEELMTQNPHRLRSAHLIGNAIKNMNYFRYRGVLLVNEDDYPLNHISIIHLFNYMINIFKNND